MSSLTAQLRIHGKIPIVRTILRSEGMQVRDGMIERLKVMAPFAGFTFSRSHALKVMPNLMPYCSVYFIGEQLTPDGDADIGEVSFHSVVRIGFSVMLINNDPDLMEDRLDDYYQLIFRGLLRDPTLQLNPTARIQGFAQGSRQHVYGSAGIQEHETPYAELRAELHCDLGAIEYEPLVEDMLESIHVETVYPPGDTNNQHIFSVYDLESDTFVAPPSAPTPPPLVPVSTGAAAGGSTAQAAGVAVTIPTGAAAAISTAQATGVTLKIAIGAAAGISTATAPATGIKIAAGSAAGISTAQAVVLPTFVTDDFNRANGALGANWTNVALNYTGNLAINSNQVAMPVAANHALAAWMANTFALDQYCEVSFPVVAPYVAPAVRVDPLTANAYFVMIYPSGGGTNYWIFAWNRGGSANLSGPFTFSAVPLVSTDVIRLEISGATLTLKLNGATVATFTDTTVMGDLLLYGSPGINIYDTTGRIDNFKAGPVTGARAPMPSGLYISDTTSVKPPAGTLKIERTQAWSCLTNFMIIRPDLSAAGNVVFTNVQDTPYTGYEIWIIPGGKIRVKIMHAFATAEQIEVDGSTIVTDGNTHMIAVSYDGSSTAAGVKIYVDGVADSLTTNMDTLAATIVTGAGDMYIGNQYPGSQFGLQGVMNFFMFSNIVRNAAYMTAHATLATKPSVDANTTLYYSFSEGAGVALADQSSNAYNATITGTGYLWT